MDRHSQARGKINLIDVSQDRASSYPTSIYAMFYVPICGDTDVARRIECNSLHCCMFILTVCIGIWMEYNLLDPPQGHVR